MPKFLKSLLLSLTISTFLVVGCGNTYNIPSGTTPEESPVIGMILVGPKNDKGWSQAHFEGGEYVVKALNGKMITVDLVNPADNPDLTIPAIAEDMINQGAEVICATSDDMKDGILEAAAKFPDTNFVWSSGDSALKEGKGYKPELTNLTNIMGQMEYGQMIAGCAAAFPWTINK